MNLLDISSKKVSTLKPKPSLLAFEWGVDSLGYDLSPDGKRVVRRGGKLVPIYPDKINDPSPHYLFAHFADQFLYPDEEPSKKRLKGNPFWARRFDDYPAAVLAWVSEFGFLGGATWGPSAESETIEYFQAQQRAFREFETMNAFNPIDAVSGSDVPQSESEKRENLVQAFNSRAALRLTSKLVLTEGQICIRSVPTSFPDWAWFRAGQDLTDGVTWSQCEFCHKPMARGGNFYRIDAKFCSNSCRILSYRPQKK